MRYIAVDENGKQTALPERNDIAGFIMKHRQDSGMSLAAVADKIGVKRQAVWSWEHGKSYPTADNLTMLVILFKSKPDSVDALSAAENVLGV